METTIYEHVMGTGKDANRRIGTLLATKEFIGGKPFVVIGASKLNLDAAVVTVGMIDDEPIYAKRSDKFVGETGRLLAFNLAVEHAGRYDERDADTTFQAWPPPLVIARRFKPHLGEFMARCARYFPGLPIIAPIIRKR